MPYPDHPTLRAEVLDLYETAWPGIAPRIRLAGELGSDWYAMSTPVVLRDRGRLIAHVGIAHVDLHLEGHRRSVTAVHAVCVHPDYRGHGLGREVMNMALDRLDREGHPTAILWSEKTAFYAKFGFECVRESVFVGSGSSRVGAAAWRLDLAEPVDRELLRRSLSARRPVSGVAAAADDGWHFLIDLALWPESQSMLHHLPELDVIAVAETVGNELHLYDLIAAEMPPMARLVGAVDPGGRTDTLVVYFSPDRLDVDLRPQPHRMEDWLHVRGEPLFPTGDFALSPFVRT